MVVRENLSQGVPIRHMPKVWMSVHVPYDDYRAGCAKDVPFFGGGQKDAQSNAHRQAHEKLGGEPAACPDCGWYQRTMVPELRRRHHGWMRGAGIGLMAAAGFCLIPTALLRGDEFVWLWPIGLSLAGAGLVLQAVQYLIAWRYDPNASWPQSPDRFGLASNGHNEHQSISSNSSRPNGTGRQTATRRALSHTINCCNG